MTRLTHLAIILLISLNFLTVYSEEKVLGYGTEFGTIGLQEKRKVIGIGAHPGFIDGDNEPTLLDVYHRYQLYRELVGEEVSEDYQSGLCGAGCPPASHCSYGLCFCDADITAENLELGSGSISSEPSADIEKIEGPCAPKSENRTFSPKMIEVEESTVKNCNESSDCWQYDINMECSASGCECREGMEYNKYKSSCNIFIDVDCSYLEHDSSPATSLTNLIKNILAGNITTENSRVSDSLLAFLEPLSSGVFTKEEITEAFCRDTDSLANHFQDREEDASLALLLVVCGVVAVVVLLVIACVCLSGCFCWCCFTSCRRKIENFFSPNSYVKGVDNKYGGMKENDGVDGEDDLEKAMKGYQPVPQHPPAGYPQGGASLPRNIKVDSLKRGELPRATYPQLADAPPGYPESPQKTGPPPLGYPQSPPEYPQTPTPPGFPASNAAKVTKALYPQIPEK